MLFLKSTIIKPKGGTTMAKYIFVFLLAFCMTAGTAVGRSNPLPDFGDGYLTFYLDNDLVSGTDEGYTNGARISWISGSRKLDEISPIQKSLRRLIGTDESTHLFRRLAGFDDPSDVTYNYGFSITQLMFTPESLTAKTAPPGQRPYAGWLGLGFSLHAKDDDVLNSVQLTIGTTGERAFAEEAQDYVHEVRGLEKFDGWDSQIPAEFTLNLNLSQKRRMGIDWKLGPLGFDTVGEVGCSLGNFRTDLYIGFVGRAGYHLPPDFSDPRLSVTAYSLRPFRTETQNDYRWSIYSLYGMRGYIVGHDITLDGPVFRDSDILVDREIFVAEAFIGFGVRFRSVEFSYAHTFRTREFEEDDTIKSFGSIALRYRY